MKEYRQSLISEVVTGKIKVKLKMRNITPLLLLILALSSCKDEKKKSISPDTPQTIQIRLPKYHLVDNYYYNDSINKHSLSFDYGLKKFQVKDGKSFFCHFTPRCEMEYLPETTNPVGFDTQLLKSVEGEFGFCDENGQKFRRSDVPLKPVIELLMINYKPQLKGSKADMLLSEIRANISETIKLKKKHKENYTGSEEERLDNWNLRSFIKLAFLSQDKFVLVELGSAKENTCNSIKYYLYEQWISQRLVDLVRVKNEYSKTAKEVGF